MHRLELKVPPLLVAALTALAMWLAAQATYRFPLDLGPRLGFGLGLALAGGCFSIAGAREFRRVRTTVNPMAPEQASTLVITGIYRRTRNPMYVGFLLVLVGWLVVCRAPAALAGPVLFVATITRLQILPEERVLRGLFGQPYTDYCTRVPRWL